MLLSRHRSQDVLGSGITFFGSGYGRTMSCPFPRPISSRLTLLKALPFLHPSILILTKLKRWCQIRASTRPKTITKARSDRSDIDFLISWMAERGTTIDFWPWGYEGKTKGALLDMFSLEDNTELVDALRSLLNGDDWNSL